MIQSKYNFNKEIGVEASKVAFKTKSKKKELFLAFAVPVALIVMIGVLIYDIHKGNSLIFDIILLALLVFLSGLNFFMPFVVAKSQNKYLTKIEDEKFDYFISEYHKGKFKEKIYKDNKMVFCNEVEIDKLMSFKEFELNGVKYFLVMFNNYASLVFDTTNFVEGSFDELIAVCENAVKNKEKVKSKR